MNSANANYLRSLKNFSGRRDPKHYAEQLIAYILDDAYRAALQGLQHIQIDLSQRDHFCFKQTITSHLSELGYDITVDPDGILFVSW